MNILLWHVHGSWTTAFLAGPHTYLLPTVAGRGPDGRGRADTWQWPAAALELTPAELADAPIDVVILQRPRDEVLAAAWLGGRRPGRDLPAVWLEHNAPQGAINEMRHPAADRADLVVVHVTPTNALLWDCGTTRTRVIEHGVIDPGYRYAGDAADGEPGGRAAVIVNEPVRRARVAGTDLLAHFAAAMPLDVFGMQVGALAQPPRLNVFENVPQTELHAAVATHRVYLHPYRWTSLGLALIEAMLLGLPIVAVATLEVPLVVPADAGVVSNDPEQLANALRCFGRQPERAREMGLRARSAALGRFGLDRFLADWDKLLQEIT